MKAITIKEAGLPHTLKILDIPIQNPSKNEVLIQQSYGGINFGDAIRRKRGLFKVNDLGYYIPGFEGVGVIVACGTDVSKYKAGERVAYLNQMGGGYGQQICVDQKYIYRIPNTIQDQTAASMTCVGLTALHLIKISQIKKGEWVLVHGATGGVGLILIQLAIHAGAKVIAVVGTVQKKEYLKKYNVTEIIVRDTEKIENEIMTITKQYGVNVIFDCVGQEVVETNINCIQKGGTILYYGSTSGHPMFPGMQILMKSIKVFGFNIFNLIEDQKLWNDGIMDLISLIEAQKLEIQIQKVFKMSEVHEAHQLMEDRNSVGKFLIDLR